MATGPLEGGKLNIKTIRLIAIIKKTPVLTYMFIGVQFAVGSQNNSRQIGRPQFA